MIEVISVNFNQKVLSVILDGCAGVVVVMRLERRCKDKVMSKASSEQGIALIGWWNGSGSEGMYLDHSVRAKRYLQIAAPSRQHQNKVERAKCIPVTDKRTPKDYLIEVS